MYGMNNYGKLFSDELTEWLIEAGFIQYLCQMYIYYKYAPDATKNVVLSYVDYFVYWYKYEALGENIVDTLGNRFNVKFLGYAHWFMSIRISHMKDHSIPVNQYGYSTSVVSNCMDNATVKTRTISYKTTFPSGMIFTKYYAYTIGDKVDKLTR